ncbi:MAG: NAD(P)/FAD-dependent oxidoreductase [Promethearchaeota archaeon]
MTYDIIIIGGGPAGLAAAIYTARMGKKTLLLEGKMFGGRAATAPQVWNYPGFPEGITGAQLIDLMVKQAEKYGTDLKYATEVVDLELEKDVKQVVTREGTYGGYAVIIATGTYNKKLRIPGETEYVGLGVSYCPVCDGPLYRGLKVAIIGSGSEAIEDAFFMSGFADKVTLVTHTSEIEAEQKLIDEIKAKANVDLIFGQLLRISGDQVVTNISYRQFEDDTEHTLQVDGVFVSIGGAPLTALVKKAGVEVDKRGCIKVTRQQITNLEGVYAAGDVTCGGMQVITAAGEGAMAGIQAYRFLKKQSS